MGQQQLLLIIVGVIIVGIAIAVGITLFNSNAVSSNKDAILNDLNNMAQYAYRYKLRPEPLGGGGRVYSGFVLPTTLASSENATYNSDAVPTKITFTATSKFGYGTVTADLDSEGVLSNHTYSGDFTN
ncbi:MAG TPA: hypothetical protein VGR15_08095 [Bacteroidota bacterium]|jgi:hypothetical protein|nr:hypothetical protein [Bacteroidota bacterium]